MKKTFIGTVGSHNLCNHSYFNMSNIKLFESKQIRSQWDAEAEKWYFSIADIVAILTESIDPLAYWRKLKEQLKKEGNETVTNCHGLKMLIKISNSQQT